MSDTYKDRILGVNSPVRKGVAVTPSDTADLASVPRALYVGVSGDITVTLADDSSSVLLKSVPVGLLPVMVSRIYATGTTATNIVALY